MPRRWLSPDFFTDERMKKATVPERLLGAAIIANQDDDGRLRGDPAYLRAIAFLYDDYSLEEVRQMRDHLAKVNPNIIVYENDEEEYIQLKRYQRYQRPRYYHPSKFPAPPDWPFEDEPLGNEYKGAVEKTIQYDIANKLRSGQWQPTDDKIIDVEINKRLGNLYADIVATTQSGAYILIEVKQYPLQFRDFGQILDYRTELQKRVETPIKSFLIGNGLGNLTLKEAETASVILLNLGLTTIVEPTSNDVSATQRLVKPTMVTLGKGEGKGKNLDLDLDKGRGKGRKVPHPAPTDLCTDINKIINKLVESFRYDWGRVLAEKPGEVIPRELGGKERAQLRDLAEELAAAGGCPLSYIREAFREAAGQGKQKEKITYLRAILLDWLGIPRAPPG